MEEGRIQEIQEEKLDEASTDVTTTLNNQPNNDEIKEDEEKCTCSLPSMPGWLKKFGSWLKAILLLAMVKMFFGLSLYTYDIISKYT